MSHRKLYWILFLISIISFIICVLSIYKLQFVVALICFLITIIARIIAKIVKVDNDFKSKK